MRTFCNTESVDEQIVATAILPLLSLLFDRCPLNHLHIFMFDRCFDGKIFWILHNFIFCLTRDRYYKWTGSSRR